MSLTKTIQWYIDNQNWWRDVKTNGNMKFFEENLYLVLKNGQVARHLSNFENVKCLDRCSANLENLDNCRYVILKNRPSAVINAAAFDVGNRDGSQFSQQVNAHAPEIMAKSL